jgi:phosphoribosylaminoimidazolecarboxamide formyltransferase/IMP cyclohydrolase
MSSGPTDDDAILEYIDIGGPALIRAAAKNAADVTVIVDPDDYEDVLAELYRYRATRDKTRRALAARALLIPLSTMPLSPPTSTTARDRSFPGLSVPMTKLQDLRYGENLHQRAARQPKARGLEPARRVAIAEQVHGKEMSFNNYLDTDAAWAMVSDFTAPAASVVKHTNPTGLAAGKTCAKRLSGLAGDPQAAYGVLSA